MIKYKNDSDQEITQEQAEQIEDFDKEFYVNNNLKYIHIYRNYKLYYINYFISPTETETDIINQFSHLNTSIYITNSSMIGAFKQEHRKEFKSNGNLSTEGKSLIAPDGQTICHLSIWSESNSNPPNTVTKEFRISGVGAYEFGYYPDGSFEAFAYSDYSDSFRDIDYNTDINGDPYTYGFDGVGLSMHLPVEGVPIDIEYFRTDVFDPTPYLI